MEAVDLSNVFKFKKLVKSMYQLGLPGVSVVKNLPTNMGFPDSSVGKESACNARDPGSVPGLGRSPGERKGYPLQYSGLDNSMVCIVHGVAKSRTRLSNIRCTFGLPW